MLQVDQRMTRKQWALCRLLGRRYDRLARSCYMPRDVSPPWQAQLYWQVVGNEGRGPDPLAVPLAYRLNAYQTRLY